MSSTLLANELTTLATDAKRKNNDLRNAAEKSLQELKSLPSTSEQQLAADLSRRPAFIEPLIIACRTQNSKFAGSGIACLQKLIVSRGLPKSRLQDALESFNACTGLGLDIQLKILQALPSLLQNYAEDLNNDLLSEALQVCFALQTAKSQTVSGVAAATLQQLVTSVFEKVSFEDKNAKDVTPTNEVPGDNAPIHLRPAAFDAYRVFRDLALAADDRKTKFMHSASLSQEASLELIWSCISANVQLFKSHDELGNIIRSNVLPSVTRALTEKVTFPLALRSLRILDLLITRFFVDFCSECEVALGLTTQSLDSDVTPLWKRALAMEVVRSFFDDSSHVIDAYTAFDMQDGGKPVVQDLLSTFVRLSAEKPAVIGLGQQSTVPVGPTSAKDSNMDLASMEAASGMAGIISSALGVAEVNVAGISSQWSLPRTACIEQLDKTEPPVIPETYLYALVLECLSSFSDSLAKVILPLIVQDEKHSRKSTDKSTAPSRHSPDQDRASGLARSSSFKKRSIPINPLEMESHRQSKRVRAVHGIVQSCWPAVLATSSTFLNAALDDQYYRNLIRSYQRVAQVAGLLRLSTARDALMTTLGKAAVPPHVLSAAMAEPSRTPVTESPRNFSNPKNLLSVENIVGQASTFASSERDRKCSLEQGRPMLTTRNLLCLRALLNLAIALGPALETAFGVVIATLRQADVILSTTTPQQMMRQSQKATESPNVVQAFSNEVAAVEAAASRLLESTADYPDEAFLNVLQTFCRLLHGKGLNANRPPESAQSTPPSTPSSHSKGRTFSSLQGFKGFAEIRAEDYKFVIPRLGNLAELNVPRFVSTGPGESGWNLLIDELTLLASSNSTPKDPRRAATAVLCKVTAEVIAEVTEDEVEMRAAIQRRSLSVLLRLIDSIYAEDGELTSADVDVQGRVVDSLRNVLEQCGDSLVAGWHRTIAIIGSVFERSGTPPERSDEEETYVDWGQVSKEFVSVPLGRTAFAATQLVCSDFLAAVSTAVVPSLIELLHRFATQEDDLNIALTTVTIAWNVSDHLLSALEGDGLDNVVQRIKDFDEFEEGLEATSRESSPSQWLLLLLRLQDIVNNSQKEVQKATFQTICSIFKNNGEQMSPETWDAALRNILLPIAFHDAVLYQATEEGATAAQGASGDESMSIAILNGASDVMSQHLGQIEQAARLPSLWEAFLGRLELYFDLERHALNTAVYQSLGRILSRVDTGTKVWPGPLYRTLALWLKRNPANVETAKGSNEEPLVAYIDAGRELHRLTKQSTSTSQTRTLVENLYSSVRYADGPRYGADVNMMSSLQTKALEFLKEVHSSETSTLVVIAAKMITLHHDTAGERPSNEGPTFVALVAEAINWLQALMRAHTGEKGFLETDGCASAMRNLRHLIDQKYLFRLEHKGLPLWQRARTAALDLATPILGQCQQGRVDEETKATILVEHIGIATGIVGANGLDQISDAAKIAADEESDMVAFQSLRAVLVSHLGHPDLPFAALQTYTRALFDASLIHPPEPSELPLAAPHSPLQNIATVRRGRVRRIPVSRRERMAYTCLRELIALGSRNDGSAQSIRLAQAALPLLILRLAIPVRAYIADQPLRGKKPQPLSELEELLFCFEAIGGLVCEPEGLGGIEAQEGVAKGEKLHLRYLYALLVRGVETAGDPWSGSQEVLGPLRRVLEGISPFE